MYTVKLIQAPGIERLSDWARWYLVKESLANQLSADAIATVLSLESGFRANLGNILGAPYGGLMGNSLKTYPDLLEWSAERQLEELVLPHFRKFQKTLTGLNHDPGAYYMTVFGSGWLNTPDEYVIGKYDDQTQENLSKLRKHCLYIQNYGFDPGAKCFKGGDPSKGCGKTGNLECSGGKGYYTTGDVKNKARNLYAGASKKPYLQIDIDNEPVRPDDTLGASTAGTVLAVMAITGLGLVLAARKKVS